VLLDRKIILVIGLSGFGKTYLARSLVTHYKRVLVVEHRPEYGGRAFYDFGALADALDTYQDAGDFFVSWLGGMDYTPAIFHLAFRLRNVLVVLEEADLVPAVGYYYEAIYRGRHPSKISIMAIAQRPHMLDIALRSQATDVYAFNNHEPSALQWLSTFFDDRTAELATLPPKRGLHFALTATGPIIRPFRLP